MSFGDAIPRPSNQPVDEFSAAFRSLDRALARRGASTTSAADVRNAVRALVRTWFDSVRPELEQALGELPAMTLVDRGTRELLAMIGGRANVAELRRGLRLVGRTIDRELVPSFQAAQWSKARTAGSEERGAEASVAVLADRLDALSPDLGQSYRQVYEDLSNPTRSTFLGPAGEIREVLRAVIHLLAPDEKVVEDPEFSGDPARPTQAERIAFILRSQTIADSPREAAEMVEEKIAGLGRQLYKRASKALHAGTQRDELEKIVRWVDAILNELLP